MDDRRKCEENEARGGREIAIFGAGGREHGLLQNLKDLWRRWENQRRRAAPDSVAGQRHVTHHTIRIVCPSSTGPIPRPDGRGPIEAVNWFVA